MKRHLAVILILLMLALCQDGLASPIQCLSQYCKSDHMPFVLTDNTSARDIGYAELIDFLATFEPKVLPSKTCGHYAEELHNYSENHWIRCAIVIANGHAFNGFKTDGIMTYVDAGRGIIGIATKSNDGLRFIKNCGNYQSTSKVLYEENFLIFWEGEE